MKKHLIRFFLLISLLCASPLYANSRQVVTSTKTTSGTVAAGALDLTFIFSSTFVGTIAGTAFTGANDASIHLATPVKGDALDAVAYTVTAGSIRVVELR